MSTATNFPYSAWKLSPSFKPTEVVIESAYEGNWGKKEVTHLISDSGRYYPVGDIYATRADAIAGGRKRLEEQEADIAKKVANITKKRAALDKAAAA